MTATPDVPLSKGMMMIAAYRAARLRQRPVLRTDLPERQAERGAADCQGQVAGEAACMAAVETSAPAPVAAALPEAGKPALVPAGPAGCDTQADSIDAPADDARPDVTAVAPPDDAGPTPARPAEPVPYDPPLAEVGFGPGMLIRLGQLGLRSAGDLAHADATTLRAALGDISRLVDVEGWIASARMTISSAPTDVASPPE